MPGAKMGDGRRRTRGETEWWSDGVLEWLDEERRDGREAAAFFHLLSRATRNLLMGPLSHWVCGFFRNFCVLPASQPVERSGVNETKNLKTGDTKRNVSTNE